MSDLRTWMNLLGTAAPAKSDNLLLELTWYDKTPLTQVLQRNRGKWIHFGQGAPNRGDAWYENPKLEKQPDIRKYSTGGYDHPKKMKQYQRELNRVNRRNATHNVPKIGINPRVRSHRDPYGIYFYPVDFLLSGSERTLTGMQYGTDMSFYYIADIDLSSPNGINLRTITWEQIEQLATQNGWRDVIDAFRAKPEEEQRKLLPYFTTAHTPGAYMWYLLKRLAEMRRATWHEALKGVQFVRDVGDGIIASEEPDQLLVLDPRIIKLREQGENKSVRGYGDEERKRGWEYAHVAILKAIRGEVGGDLTWRDKKPTLAFQVGSANFKIAQTDSYSLGNSLLVNYTFGRAEGSFTVSEKNLEASTVAQTVEHVLAKVKRIGGFKTDLLFRPVISEADAQSLLQDQVGDGSPLNFQTTIYNDLDGSRYDSIMVRGNREIEPARNVVFSTMMTSQSDRKNFNVTITVKRNGSHVVAAHTNEGVTPHRTDQALDQLAEAVRDGLDQHHFKPMHPDYQYARYSWLKMPTEALWRAYKGWLVVHCGVSLEGRLRRFYAADVAFYEAFEDKDELLYRIGNLKDSF